VGDGEGERALKDKRPYLGAEDEGRVEISADYLGMVDAPLGPFDKLRAGEGRATSETEVPPLPRRATTERSKSASSGVGIV